MVDGTSGLGQGAEPGKVVELAAQSDHPASGVDVATRMAAIRERIASHPSATSGLGEVAAGETLSRLKQEAGTFEAHRQARDSASEAGLPGRGGLQLVGGTEVEAGLQPDAGQTPPTTTEPQE